MAEYDFEMVHRPGTQIAHADALSRARNEPAREVQVATEQLMRIDICTTDWLCTMQQQDPKLLRIMQVLRGEIKADDIQQLRHDYTLKLHRLFRKIETELKWVVPESVRLRIMKYSHDDRGHFGLEKTLQNVQQEFWFPRMRNYSKGYLSACVKCCLNELTVYFGAY